MTDRRNSNNEYPEWATPRRIWKPLAEAVNGFDLDPASGAEPEPIAETRYTIEDDGLNKPWFGDVWLNYPYGREEHPVWTQKALRELQRDEVDSITVLAPASTDTSWFQSNLAEADRLTFVDGRISFIGAGEDKNNVAAFSSVLATFGDMPTEYMNNLHDIGFVTKVETQQSKLITDGGVGA